MGQATRMTTDLAIFGGTPVRPRPVPVTVTISNELKRDIGALLDNAEPLGTYYGGTHCRRFEDAFAAAPCAGRSGVATNSGTSALHVALAVAGVGPGDEVIIQALWPGPDCVVMNFGWPFVT